MDASYPLILISMCSFFRGNRSSTIFEIWFEIEASRNKRKKKQIDIHTAYNQRGRQADRQTDSRQLDGPTYRLRDRQADRQMA